MSHMPVSSAERFDAQFLTYYPQVSQWKVFFSNEKPRAYSLEEIYQKIEEIGNTEDAQSRSIASLLRRASIRLEQLADPSKLSESAKTRVKTSAVANREINGLTDVNDKL